jgi:hypothetical protein
MIRCAEYMKKSTVFGSFNQNSISFSVTTSQLTSMAVYSDQQIEAIIFNFTNGVSKVYGSPLNNELKLTHIDLVNKQIVAAIIGYDNVIKSLQFLLYQNITKQYTWSRRMGGTNKSQVMISLPTNAPNASSFKISTISGSTNSQQILTLSVSYIVKDCKPSFNIETIPTTPPLKLRNRNL